MTFRSHVARLGTMLWLLGALLSAQTNQPAPAAAITISGEGIAQLTLRVEDLASMPREKATVPEQDGTEVEYEGVPLREILRKAGVPAGKLRGKALTTCVLAKAHDGYQVVFTLGEIDAEFGNQQILVADKRGGKALFGYQGPFRLVCPHDKAGARSVRMLEALEIIRLQR